MASGLVPRTAMIRHFLRIACRFYGPRFTIPASRNFFRRGFRGQDCSSLMNFSSCIAYAVLGKITKGAEAFAGD
jgi:hypothetical protein